MGNCSTIQVASGDSCGSLATRCGINATDFYQYNPASNLCSTLQVGQHVCCTAGTMPDYTPQTNADGSCYSYDVQAGDSCSELGAAYNLTLNQIETFNKETWGWLGCDDLQAKENICLSPGTPPFPASVANTVCGPQVPGTTSNLSSTEWASLNPCPLNACCDIWGQCGTTSEFCTVSTSTTGAPGTAANGSNGCISNCGTDIIMSPSPPAEFAKIGYFEAFNLQRSCLTMYAYSIDQSKYTHIHYAFGNITSDFQVNDGGYTEQFQIFTTELTQVKRIMSFGGWAFSTDPSTYMIFREGVTEANRQTLAQNVASFIISNDLDGVDFDWEYPGEPDIKGIPAASLDDGGNYFEFLQVLRSLLPSGKTISVAAPASYWYLKGFPISDIAVVVDYIVFMTYDLHGTWDLDSTWSQEGCPAGDCLRSDINGTETINALSMITKAGVPSNKIMVGVTSYGRSFTMSTAGCTGPECTWTGPGLAGECTQTAGIIANAEINEIIATNPSAQQIYDGNSASDILVYNDTQWVGYMSDSNKAGRQQFYANLNMGGISDWAIDLQEFIPLDILDLEKEWTNPTDYDMSCINLISSGAYSNSTDELNAYLDTACSYIDSVFKIYAADPFEWNVLMTQHVWDSNCHIFPGDFCTQPEPLDCSNSLVSEGLYWAQFIIYNYYSTLNQWYNAFEAGQTISSDSIDTICNTFAPQAESGAFSGSTVLDNLVTGMGLAAPVLGGVPGFTQANTVLTEADTIVDLLLGDELTLPTADDLEAALTSLMATFYSNTLTAISNMDTWVFEYPGNLSSMFPSSQLQGSYTSDVANYFYNIAPLFIADNSTFLEMVQKINMTISAGLAGAALGAGDYYIVKNGMTLDDCSSSPACAEYNGNSYQLGYPGAAGCIKGLSIGTWATSDTINALGTYGVNLVDLVSISEACQNNTNQYFGTMTAGITPSDIYSSGNLPQCFYNLPVFFTFDSPAYASAEWDSPCYVTTTNSSATTAVVGFTYLPNNLSPFFTATDCECGDGNPVGPGI